MKKKLLLLKIAIVILLLGFILCCHTAWDIYSFGKQNEVTKADAVLVLGASVWGDEPSPVFRERINHGIWLYKNGYASKIIFSGGNRHFGNIEALVAERYAKNNQIPQKDIIIETKSRNTEENIFFSKEIIRENGFEKIIIVSDPLHMKRVIKIAEDNGLVAFSSYVHYNGVKLVFRSRRATPPSGR